MKMLSSRNINNNSNKNYVLLYRVQPGNQIQLPKEKF